MPRAVLTNPVTYENFTRPVALIFIREVARVLRLPGDIKVIFPGNTEEIANTGSTLSYDPQDTVFSYGLHIQAEIQERSVEDRMITLHAHENEYHPIFQDPAIGVRIFPIYAHSEMQISFKIRFSNRVEAQKMRDDLLTRIAMLRQEDNHELTYHYSIPNPFMHLLRDIHKLRETVAPYGETFNKWMNDHLDYRSTVLSNVAGNRTLLAIAENQTRIWGTFTDINALVENAQKDNETGRYSLNFDYRVQYDKPIACRAEWPLVVHNQFIPAPWYDDTSVKPEHPDHWRRAEHRSWTREAFDFLAFQDMELEREAYAVARVPDMDDWTTDHRIPDIQPFVQLLVGVKDDDPTNVLDLRHLDSYYWDEDVLQWLHGEAAYMTSYGQSLYYVQLYEDDRPFHTDDYYVDSELVLRSRKPLDLRKVYHVRICMLTDLMYLSPAAARRTRCGSLGGWKSLVHLQYLLHRRAVVPPYVDGACMSQADYDSIALHTHSQKIVQHNARAKAPPFTVGTFTIIARRQEK